MKFAVISDVHGNYPALHEILDDAAANYVDRFIFLGDYIFDLPFGNEAVHEIVQIKNAVVIRGNKENYLKRLEKEDQSAWLAEQWGVLYQTYRELQEQTSSFLRTLGDEASVPLESGGFIFAAHCPCEISPWIERDCSSTGFYDRMLKSPFTHEQYLSHFEQILGREEYQNFFLASEARVYLFGHNHLQCHGYCEEKLIVNPGSCGQPLDFDNRAAYTILEETGDGFRVDERRVEYDIEAAIRAAKNTKTYEAGRIWSELVFLALRTGRDYVGVFFELASQIAAEKSEAGGAFTNETWREAWSIFDGWKNKDRKK